MATGFSVMDALNKNSKAGIDESPKARFRTKDISIFKMYRNEMNFYKVADIEELAGDILIHGLKQNLELVYEPCGVGEYRIIAGERRWEALKLLVKKGYKEFEIATCKLTTPQDADEEQVEIISANAYRTKSIADTIEEEQRLKASLERMRAAGKQIKGYDLNSGRLRDVIASMLRMSKTKVAQIESVSNNLIPEFKEELNKERLTFSAAYELSGMTEEEQREALAAYGETGELTHKDIKTMKGGKAAGQQDLGEPEAVSESDTEGYVLLEEDEAEGLFMNPPEELETEGENWEQSPQSGYGKSQGGDYETPHPEGITSICYSCTEYETCNVKTGTCTKCDQYKNRTEAYKTEEQKYSEKQDRIDRETKKKLREMQQEEKMDNLPSDVSEGGQKIHQIRLASKYFDDVCSGKKSFELQKNDRGFKVGDILEMTEFKDGRATGRMVRVIVTYFLDGFTGIEDGYCILATAPIDGNGGELQEAAAKQIRPSEPVRPEFPLLKNNDQRKEWLGRYKDWGLWYEDENIGCRYYKYDFENGARLIAETYLIPKSTYFDEHEVCYLHLIGGPEPPKDKTKCYGKWQWNERYNKHPSSETEIIEFLKYVAKEKNERGRRDNG